MDFPTLCFKEMETPSQIYTKVIWCWNGKLLENEPLGSCGKYDHRQLGLIVRPQEPSGFDAHSG